MTDELTWADDAYSKASATRFRELFDRVAVLVPWPTDEGCYWHGPADCDCASIEISFA